MSPARRGRVVLGVTSGVDTAEGAERLRGGGTELERLVGQQRVHVDPLSSALDTIIRCTSIVPDATVAAWA